MRLVDLVLAYLVVGVGCAWALRARNRPEGSAPVTDVLLIFTLWPLYVPVLLGASTPSRRVQATPRAVTARVLRERDLLVEAIEHARGHGVHPTLAPLLPSPEQLTRLTEHLLRVDARVQELDEVLATEEFDTTRAERRLREAERSDRGAAETAAAAVEGSRRLQALRERAARERDELLGLCARLRMQVTLLRFAAPRAEAASPGEDLGELVGELMGRIEGVGAALDPTP